MIAGQLRIQKIAANTAVIDQNIADSRARTEILDQSIAHAQAELEVLGKEKIVIDSLVGIMRSTMGLMDRIASFIESDDIPSIQSDYAELSQFVAQADQEYNAFVQAGGSDEGIDALYAGIYEMYEATQSRLPQELNSFAGSLL